MAEEIAAPPQDAGTDPGAAVRPEAGAELQRAQQYLQFWRLSVRLEYLMLALIGVFAVSVGVAFVVFDLGEDDITGSWGYPVLWIISLLRASSVLIPIPGSGLTVAAGAVMEPLGGIPVPIAVGVTAGTAESIGEFTGYYAGLNGGRLMEGRKLYDTVRVWLGKSPFATMFVMAFMPSPVFDVAGLAAGAARIPVRIFYPAILLGKIGRGIVMAAAGYWASGVLLDIIDLLELQILQDMVGTTPGKVLLAGAILIAIPAGYYLIRRFRGQLAEWL
jgi:membrane protein DedA with SNARE-associated domain